MKNRKLLDSFKLLKKQTPAKYGVGKFGGSRVGAHRPGNRGK